MDNRATEEGLILNLPQEILTKNIYPNASLSGLNNLAQTCKFFYTNLIEYKQEPQLIQRNLADFNCTKHVFNHTYQDFDKILISSHQIFGLTTNNIYAWDIDVKTLLWHFRDFIYITAAAISNDNYLIYSGYETAHDSGRYILHDKSFIKVIELRTGKILKTIKHNELDPIRVQVVNEIIIANLKNNTICCWNLNGDLLNQYAISPSEYISKKLLATTQYIVYVSEHRLINIIDRETNKISLVISPGDIVAVFLQKNQLICGLYKHYIAIVDISLGKIINTYKVDNLDNHASISSIVATKNLIFVVSDPQKVIVIDSEQHSSKVLEQGRFGYTTLELYDNYLFVFFRYADYLYIWDASTLSKIIELRINGLNRAIWYKGALSIATHNQLINYDFKNFYPRLKYREEEANLLNLNKFNKLFKPRPLGYDLEFAHSAVDARVIYHNLLHFNCESRKFDNKQKNNKLLVCSACVHLLVTSGCDHINIWNINTKSLWTRYRDFTNIHNIWAGNYKIIGAGNKNHYSGKNKNKTKNKIIIYDLRTNNQTILKYQYLNPRLVVVTKDQIVAKIKNNTIVCYDFLGRILSEHKSSATYDLAPLLLANQTYICEINYRVVTIINKTTGLNSEVQLPSEVNVAIMRNNRLICGLFRRDLTIPDVVVIHLASAQIYRNYKVADLFSREQLSYNAGYITDLVAADARIFVAYKSGTVIGIDLVTHEYKILESRAAILGQLKCCGNFLLIKFRAPNNDQSQLCIWDIKQMKKINELEMHALDDAIWHQGSLIIAANLKLIQYDFNILNYKNSLTSNKAQKQILSRTNF